MDNNITLRLNPDFKLREIAGEHLVIPTGEAALALSGMMSLNGSGLFLWQVLQSGCTRGELLARLMEEYEVDEATASRDVDAFLERMKSVNLLVTAE